MSKRLSRLARTSPAELRDRLAQRGWVAIERLGLLPAGELPNDGSLLPVLPFASQIVADREPDGSILEQADRLVLNRFDLLGYAGLDFGEPVDWHLDPVSGRSAPLVHWSRVPYLDERAVGDHKVTWELNRHQFLVTLGQAWRLSGNRAYLDAFARLVEGWLEANPAKQGINWASSLELAFRAIAWTWALHLAGEELPPRLRERMVRCLDLHGRHIEQHLSTWFSPNTHLTGEALGLLYLGSAWPGFRRAGRWQALGWRILREELERQVRPDGTYFEQSSWYQAYTVDFYVHALHLAESARLEVPPGFRERVHGAASVLAALMRPDGTIPLIGDDDGGRLLPLGARPPVSFRDTLSQAAAVLKRPDLAPGSPAAFRDGGWFIVRESAGPRLHMVIDAGPHGALTGAHAHADALSVDLSLGGTPLISDPGSCRYIGAERDRFRSTAWHSTLSIPGHDSARPGGTFRWETFPETTVGAWQTGPGYARFDGWHDGWELVAPGLRHHRSVLQLDGLGVIVLDRLAGPTGDRLPEAEIRWHCAPGIAAVHLPEGGVDLRHSGRTVAVLAVSDGTPSRLDAGQSAPCYGSCRESAIVVATPSRAVLERGCLTAILTGQEATGARVVAEHAGDVTGWRLLAPDLEATIRRSGTGLEWSVLAGGGPGLPKVLTLRSEAPR